MVPCCLKVISCNEHEKVKDAGGPGVGGAIGKKSGRCPNDAEEAHLYSTK